MAAVYWLTSSECGSCGDSGATLTRKQPAKVKARNGSDAFTAGVVAAPSVNAGRQVRRPGALSWSMSVEGESEASATRKAPAMPLGMASQTWRTRGRAKAPKARQNNSQNPQPPSFFSFSLSAGGEAAEDRDGGRRTRRHGRRRARASQRTDCAVGSG